LLQEPPFWQTTPLQVDFLHDDVYSNVLQKLMVTSAVHIKKRIFFMFILLNMFRGANIVIF